MVINVLEYLEETVLRYPEAIAIEDESTQVLFRDLRKNALTIASQLIESGLQLGEPVAVLLPKSAKAIECFLGIMYAGGFYIPLDVSNPSSRLKSILHNVEPAVVLTSKEYFKPLCDIYIEERIVICTDISEGSCDAFNFTNVIDSDPAYLINTSGSTGVPKGVVISHRSIVDYIEWAIKTYEIDQNFVIGNQAPFVFDNSVLDIYLMLATGAKLVLIPEKKFMFPTELIDFLDSRSVNFIFWVPSIMANVAKVDALKGRKLKSMTHILFAGEVMPMKVYHYWKEHISEALYSNLYGPTEITVDCTYIIIDRDYTVDEQLPIGRPCANTNILVLSDSNELVLEQGVVGELCVRGSSLSLGYYKNPEKTAEVFVQNPLNDRYPELIYRTGDLVFYNPDGELMYAGRKDFQVKHKGYRIELGEIEAAASTNPGVGGVCVLYDHEKAQIVLICEAGSEQTKLDLLRHLHGALPKYMVPTRIEILSEMPLTPNGKINRVMLGRRYIGV